MSEVTPTGSGAIAPTKKLEEDYLWFLNQWQLREQYGDQVVVAHDRQILGSGLTGGQARADAAKRATERGVRLPEERDLLVFIMPQMAWLDDPGKPTRQPVPLSPALFSPIEGGQ